MQIELRVLIPSANQMPKISQEADKIAEQMMSDLRMLREQLKEAQTRMILEANKSRLPHEFKVGDSVFLVTMLVPISYANISKSELANLNSRKFSQPLCGPFRIIKAIGANSLRLNTPAHWKMLNVFNISRLKPEHVDYGQDHPPPQLVHRMTDKDPQYEVEAILEHRGTAGKTLQYKLNWLGYAEPDWQLLAILKGGCRDLL